MRDRMIRISSGDFLEWSGCFVELAKFKEVIGKDKDAEECHQMHHDICEKWNKGKEVE